MHRDRARQHFVVRIDFVGELFRIEQAFLGTGYPVLWDDPSVVASFRKWMPDIALKDVFKTHYEHAVPISGWKAAWYPDFNSTAQPILANAITGSSRPSAS